MMFGASVLGNDVFTLRRVHCVEGRETVLWFDFVGLEPLQPVE